MKDGRYRMCLAFISSLLLVLVSCNHHEGNDDYPVSEVRIMLDWSKITGELPDGIRAVFYPIDAKGRKVDAYLPVEGGSVNVSPGKYSVVIYNYNTESVRIRGEGDYETIEAYTGHCNGLGIPGTEEMVWEPDPLYLVNVDELEIDWSDQAILLTYQPKPVVKTYSFSAEVDGLQYVADVIGYVEGMADCYRLGTEMKTSSGCPIYFEVSHSKDKISGHFSSFGDPLEAARAEGILKLTLAFIRVDNTVQKLEMDITEVIHNTDAGYEEGGQQPEIELPVDEGGITVEKPENPDPGGGGGGIGGSVDGWGDEDGVEL